MQCSQSYILYFRQHVFCLIHLHKMSSSSYILYIRQQCFIVHIVLQRPSESTCLPRRIGSMDISQQFGVRYSRTCFAQKQTFLVLASILVCLLSLIVAGMTDVPLPSLAKSVAVDGSQVFHWLISQKQISALKHSSNKTVQAATALRDDPRLTCPQRELMSTLLHSVESFSICVQVLEMAEQKRAKARADALDSTGFWDLTGVINTYDTVSDPVAAGMICSRIDDFV